MFDFFNRLFGAKPSSQTAKERLRLVLLSDHLELAPDVVDALKNDLIAVISRYCEVDADHCDVTFERQDKHIAMLANIPILGMQRPTARPPAAPPPDPPATVDAVSAQLPVKAAHTNGRRRKRKPKIAQGAPSPQPT